MKSIGAEVVWIVLTWTASAAVIGCGTQANDDAFIAGKIKLRGQPVGSRYQVTFQAPSMGIGATAPLANDGSFTIRGAVRPGEYLVTVSVPPPALAATLNSPTSAGEERVPYRYRDAATSELRVNVVAGKNQVELDLQP